MYGIRENNQLRNIKEKSILYNKQKKVYAVKWFNQPTDFMLQYWILVITSYL